MWSLKATDDFRHMYSSSRDGTVLHTCLSSRVSSFLLHEEKPILSIAPEHGLLNGSKEVGTIWVGTTSSDVHGWKPPSVQDTGYSPGVCMAYVCADTARTATEHHGVMLRLHLGLANCAYTTERRSGSTELIQRFAELL